MIGMSSSSGGVETAASRIKKAVRRTTQQLTPTELGNKCQEMSVNDIISPQVEPCEEPAFGGFLEERATVAFLRGQLFAPASRSAPGRVEDATPGAAK
jgi:hypothetical protein